MSDYCRHIAIGIVASLLFVANNQSMVIKNLKKISGERRHYSRSKYIDTFVDYTSYSEKDLKLDLIIDVMENNNRHLSRKLMLTHLQKTFIDQNHTFFTIAEKIAMQEVMDVNPCVQEKALRILFALVVKNYALESAETAGQYAENSADSHVRAIAQNIRYLCLMHAKQQSQEAKS